MTFLNDLFGCLRFFSRLPLPRWEAQPATRPLAQAVAAAPLAGALIGLLGAIAILVGHAASFPDAASAALAVAVLVVASGALHEDGLADCADGFGGGANKTRKLEIMRDSRIGTFGACALVLSLALRITCVAAIAAQSVWLAATCLIAAASLSRLSCMVPLMLLPPARPEGLGAAAGRPELLRFLAGFALAVVLSLPVIAAGDSFGRVVLATLAAMGSGIAVSALARRQIGGATGDVAGAAQQLAEITVLLVFARG